MAPTDEYAPIADLYDLWALDVDSYVPFYVSEAVGAGGPVLEVGVGTGRVAAAIAAAGPQVVGTDVSPSMLARARRRVVDEGIADRVELVDADMRDFDLGRQFPLAIMPHHVFAHALTVTDQLDALGAIRRHLQPGGRLILDLPVPTETDFRARDDLHREGRFTLDDGTEAVLWRAVDFEPGTQLLRFHFVVDRLAADGTVTDRSHAESTVRQCSPGEVEHALARAGFRVDERWGWFDRRPYDGDSPELVWAAVREDAWQRRP